MSCSGVAVRTCRMLQRCFLAVETTDLRSAKLTGGSPYGATTMASLEATI